MIYPSEIRKLFGPSSRGSKLKRQEEGLRELDA